MVKFNIIYFRLRDLGSEEEEEDKEIQNKSCEITTLNNKLNDLGQIKTKLEEENKELKKENTKQKNQLIGIQQNINLFFSIESGI